MEKLTATVNKMIEASKNVDPIKYVDTTDKEYMECAGAYSSAMTNAIISDIRKLGLLLGREDIETSKILFDISTAVSDKDIQLRRLFDDRNDDRPLSDYTYESTEDILDNLSKVKDINIMQEDPYKNFLCNFKIWAEKIAKMDIFAYYINSYSFIDSITDDLEFGFFKDEDAVFIKALITLEKILLRTVIRLPLKKSLSSDCIDRIELINGIIQIIKDGDTEKLDKLYKYADAVADFSE